MIRSFQVGRNKVHSHGYAIKSTRHDAYYVSTKIYGAGIEDGVTGVWLIFGSKSKPRMIQSVDGTAKNFTPEMPYSLNTKVRASINDGESQQVRAHAKRNLIK